ncbi:MAG TPA: hypothetical protein VH309_15005, partial [Elusimicrobiota bacterium]|nr:hypothetical protein [Elusimicrobiota bacterium]
RHYTATVGADGSVTLRRAGTKDGEGGEITTSKAQLSADRDAQIRGSGTVLIGGQPYYVLGQGGEKGSFLFFSEAGMQAAPNGNAHPDLMGDVAHVVGDGSTAPITGKPDLGQLQDGSPWHLEFNMVSRLWEVKPGIGDQPKKKKDGTGDPTGGSTPPATSTSTDANGDANNPAPADPTAGAPTTLDQAIALAEQDKADKSQVWTEDSSNAGFDAATKSQLRIMSNVQSGMKHFNVLFDPSLGVHDNHFEFQTISQNIRLLRIRGVGKYVAMEYATNSQYYDLKNFANYVQHVYDSSLSYSEAGSYSTSNGMMQNVTDQDIMVDILVHRLKVKANDPMIATLRARVAKNVPKDSGYVINGDTTTVYLGYGEVGMTIWPNEVLAGDKDSNAGLTGLRGPGTAVSVTGGEAGDFKTEMDMGSGRTATLVKKANGAALYAGAEDENDKGVIKTSKVWYVMIQYKKNKLDSRSKPLPVFGGLGRFPMPAGVSLQGLPSSDLPDTTQLMMEYGSTQEDGAIAAYRTTLPDAQGGSNVRDKAGNCAGPVLWWGRVTEQQAQNACASDSKIR